MTFVDEWNSGEFHYSSEPMKFAAHVRDSTPLQFFVFACLFTE